MRLFRKKPIMFFSRMSLKRRLILIIAVIIVFSISISNIMVMNYSRNRLLRLSDELIGNTIDQVSKNVSEVLISKVYTISDILMQDDTIYNMLANGYYWEAEKFLKLPESEKDKETNKLLFSEKITNRYLMPFKEVQIAALIGKNGEVIYVNYSDEQTKEAVLKMRQLVEESKKSFLAARFFPLQKNFFINRESNDKRENQVIIASRSLIRPDTGEYFGAVIFVIPERTIFNTYSNIKLGKTGEIFVFSKNGEMISCSNEEKLTDTKISNEYLSLLGNNSSEVKYLNENSKDILIDIKPIKSTEWFVAGKVPVSEISENVNVLLVITLLMITIAIIISLVFISVLVESIVKPVKRIIDAMKKAERGNLDVTVEVSGQYEISEIAKYFNSMIIRIRTLIMEEYEIEKKKKEAELNVLMGQINPHFLYNTLESIVWKAQVAGEPEICEMAASLGRLYRISVSKGTLQVKVSEEIEHVKAYMDIQKIRFKDKFECEVSVEEKEILDYFTLKMLLQPIVENAIAYGVEQANRNLKILIEARRINDVLVFLVADNGAGMSPEEVDRLNNKINSGNTYIKQQSNLPGNKNTGIGLKNINDRIKLYFGDKYGLSIESKKGVGTKVTVSVPLICDESFKF